MAILPVCLLASLGVSVEYLLLVCVRIIDRLVIDATTIALPRVQLPCCRQGFCYRAEDYSRSRQDVTQIRSLRRAEPVSPMIWDTVLRSINQMVGVVHQLGISSLEDSCEGASHRAIYCNRYRDCIEEGHQSSCRCFTLLSVSSMQTPRPISAKLLTLV